MQLFKNFDEIARRFWRNFAPRLFQEIYRGRDLRYRTPFEGYGIFFVWLASLVIGFFALLELLS